MSQLVASLIRPVVRALALAGVTQKELLGGAIEHTDLMWQAPPLRSDVQLHGVPVTQLFDSHAPRLRGATALYELWVEALQVLRIGPYKVCDAGGYRALSYCLPHATPGQRNYWLTPPEGFPAVDEYVGIRLSLECAHLVSLTLPVRELVDDPDNFYAVTEDGYEIGVRDGLPIVEADQWDLPVHGMVQDLLHFSRGTPFVGCDYDLIAKLRSVAHTHRDMVQDFEGVELALQGLRILANGKNLPQVHAALSGLDQQRKVNDHRVRVIRDAIEVSTAFAISDRARVLAIRALLVPEIVSPSGFKTKLFSGDKIPPSLTQRSMEKLRVGLQLLLEEERSH